MANNTKATDAAKVTKAEPTQAAHTNSAYPAEELADNHKILGVSREIVVVALRQAGKTHATVAEAKAIIDKFKNKEVK